MLSDISAATVTADSVAFGSSGRVKAISYISQSTGGNLVLRDGGASGPVRLSLATPAASGSHYLELPENGIRFDESVYVVLGDTSSVTVFVG